MSCQVSVPETISVKRKQVLWAHLSKNIANNRHACLKTMLLSRNSVPFRSIGNSLFIPCFVCFYQNILFGFTVGQNGGELVKFNNLSYLLLFFF